MILFEVKWTEGYIVSGLGAFAGSRWLLHLNAGPAYETILRLSTGISTYSNLGNVRNTCGLISEASDVHPVARILVVEGLGSHLPYACNTGRLENLGRLIIFKLAIRAT